MISEKKTEEKKKKKKLPFIIYSLHSPLINIYEYGRSWVPYIPKKKRLISRIY